MHLFGKKKGLFLKRVTEWLNFYGKLTVFLIYKDFGGRKLGDL